MDRGRIRRAIKHLVDPRLTGIAILAYRSLETVWGELRRSVKDVAWRCSIHEASGHFARIDGEVRGFDWGQLRVLLKRRVDAHVWLVFGLISVLISLSGLIIPKADLVSISTAVPILTWGFVAGIVLVLVLTLGYRSLWWVSRERWWSAHVWLTWLEQQGVDPLSLKNVNPSNDLVLLVYHTRHSAFQRFLDELWAGRRGQPITLEDRQAIDRWNAEVAKRWKYRFASEAWRRWQVETLVGANNPKPWRLFTILIPVRKPGGEQHRGQHRVSRVRGADFLQAQRS